MTASTADAAPTVVWKDKKRRLWVLGIVVPLLPIIGIGLRAERRMVKPCLLQRTPSVIGSVVNTDDFKV